MEKWKLKWNEKGNTDVCVNKFEMCYSPVDGTTSLWRSVRDSSQGNSLWTRSSDKVEVERRRRPEAVPPCLSLSANALDCLSVCLHLSLSFCLLTLKQPHTHTQFPPFTVEQTLNWEGGTWYPETKPRRADRPYWSSLSGGKNKLMFDFNLTEQSPRASNCVCLPTWEPTKAQGKKSKRRGK